MIDFDACASIVVQGDGQIPAWKPVLHAGEVGMSSNSITGHLVDAATMTAISGAKGIVALEAKDAKRRRSHDNAGGTQTPAVTLSSARFQPESTMSWHWSRHLWSIDDRCYAATITSGVQPGNALERFQCMRRTRRTRSRELSRAWSQRLELLALLPKTGLVALPQMTIGGANVQVTIPLVQQQSTLAAATTVSNSSCPANTDCVTYALALPAALPYLGAFSTSGS